MKSLCLAALAIGIFSTVNGFKVLGVLPLGARSHFAIGHAILKNLAEAGHDVTVISPYPLKKPIKNYRDISTKDILDKYEKGKIQFCDRVL